MLHSERGYATQLTHLALQIHKPQLPQLVHEFLDT